MTDLVLFGAFNYVVLSLLRIGHANPLKYLAITWFLGLLVALFLPEDVLSTSSVVALFVHVVSYLLPVDRFASNNTFYDVAAVYYSVTLVGFPFACRLVSNAIRDNPRRGILHLDRERFSFKHYLASFSVSIFFALFFLVWWFLFSGEDTRFFKSGSSRLELGIFGMFIQVTAAALITMSFLIIKKVMVGRCWRA